MSFFEDLQKALAGTVATRPSLTTLPSQTQTTPFSTNFSNVGSTPSLVQQSAPTLATKVSGNVLDSLSTAFNFVATNAGKFQETIERVPSIKAFGEGLRTDYSADAPPDTPQQIAAKASFPLAFGFGGLISASPEGEAIKAIEEVVKGIKLASGLTKGLSHPEIGKIDLYAGKLAQGDQKGFGLLKIQAEHPEVIPRLGELKDAKIVERLPERLIIETQGENPIRAIVDTQLGKEKKTFLSNAYLKDVPREGVEPPTQGSSNLRSTAELPRPPENVANARPKVNGKTVQTQLERGFVSSAKNAFPENTAIAGQYIPRETDTLAIKAKNLIKDDLHAAEKLAMTGTDDRAVATASELLKHYGAEAKKATSQAVKNALYDQQAKIANTIAPKLTEAGRTVQAASILGRLTPEGQVRFAASQIQKYNEGVSVAKLIPELTGEQTKNIVTEMKAINEMANGTERAMRFQKLQNYITDLVPTPLFKKILTVWKAGLLTGLKTSGVNMFANLSHAVTETAKNIPASIVDRVVSLFTGKRSVVSSIKGLFTGGKEGVKKGLQYFKTGFDERNIGTKLDFNRINFGKGTLAKGLQAYTDTVFRLLGSEDQPFYYASKLRSLYEQAKVAAINKGLKGGEAQKFINTLMQNPTEDMIKYASFDAETAVFQNKTALGDAAKSIQNIGGGAGQVVVPFGRTPSAVAMQIFNYSPAGIVKTIFQNVGKGKFDQRLFSQGIGRGLTGTAALALGAELYKKGLITTARPTGEKEQKLWELEGKQPNSIKIGGKWRQVQVLGPVGNLLLIGGGFQKSFDNSGSPSEAISKGLADASLSFSQQTFLTGVSNFIDAVSDPARSAQSVAGSTLASTIPTIVSDVARATDTSERRASEITDKLIARIPGVRESLPPQVNVLGQEKGTVGNPLEIMADPTRPSESQSSPVVSELRRLWDAGYQVSPTLLGDKNGYKGLTPEQNTELWKRAGEITNEKLTSLFSNEQYQSLSDDEKGKVVEDITNKSKTVARAEVVLNLTQGLQGEELKKKLSELKTSGLMTKDVFTTYQGLR